MKQIEDTKFRRFRYDLLDHLISGYIGFVIERNITRNLNEEMFNVSSNVFYTLTKHYE